ncbi:carboxymuconolactone decarboxylase family protein [Geomicrobium sp. JCM 19038]|uniref:carboxymuconolactone decarboxylase family protein n=1 Tax=Geomicrobium sp. JCM 19038 TaxID=1460635 RepID=UPI00045F2597|nr:carboxymuconolactone decarboxylase family protein [Geomicrobium sp. JCM 19038]GAK09651.1 possible carboxymuconolactone decarboxylase family protein [Geomicrobium sp. JCM 19038]
MYNKSYFSRLGEFKELAPAAFQAFMAFDQQALREGQLNGKLKELIAVAVAHTTGCPYCIELHVNQVKQKGATKGEMAEAVMVATALKAGSAIAHSVNALNAYDDFTEDSLYESSYFKRLPELKELSPGAFKTFIEFDQEALKPGTLTKKEKELIAIAVAHTTGCPYCIELHTDGVKKAGASKEEVAEAVMVATALKAGSALAHGVNALNAYDS